MVITFAMDCTISTFAVLDTHTAITTTHDAINSITTGIRIATTLCYYYHGHQYSYLWFLVLLLFYLRISLQLEPWV